MRLKLVFIFFVAAACHAAEEPVTAPSSARPQAVKCQPSMNVWVEIDAKALPRQATAESRKRVLLALVDSASSRSEVVVCSYATRGREVTSSYSIRCINPRKERGLRHAYTCR